MRRSRERLCGEHDALVDPDAKVPPAARWRAQVVSMVDRAQNIWWRSVEGQGKTRAAAIEEALA